SAAGFTTTPLPLPVAKQFHPSTINNPLNADGTPAIDGDGDMGDDNTDTNSPSFDVDNRILKAGEYNNTIVATHKVAVGAAHIVGATVALNKFNNPIKGSGYVVGDVLDVNGGTFTTQAQLTVDSVDGGGGVITVHVSTQGSYTDFTGIDGTVTDVTTPAA